jgi:hypothetical protein
MHMLTKYACEPHVAFIVVPLPFDAHAESASPMQLVCPATHTSSTQIAPSQYSAGAQSTSSMQPMSTHTAPPFGNTWHSSVAVHPAWSQGIGTHTAASFSTTHSSPGSHVVASHGFVPVAVDDALLVAKPAP